MTAIGFSCVVYKVQTLVDKGIRVTLDLSENETLAAMKLMEGMRYGATYRAELDIEIRDNDQDEDGGDEGDEDLEE